MNQSQFNNHNNIMYLPQYLVWGVGEGETSPRSNRRITPVLLYSRLGDTGGVTRLTLPVLEKHNPLLSQMWLTSPSRHIHRAVDILLQ